MRGSPLLAIAALLAACGGRGAPPPAGPAPSSGAKVPTSDDGAAPSPAEPTACTLTPSHGLERIEVDGVVREYVRVVGDAVSGPVQVLLVWHGFGSNPEQMLAGVRPELWSDAILVAPLGLPRTFEQFGDNERPGFQVHAGELDDRDLHLFDAILEDLRKSGCIDEARVYTTGFSNGGFFSNVLACHRGDRIAAAAPVGGGGPFATECGRPVPVLLTHGRDDKVVSVGSAKETWAFWMKHGGCSEAPALPLDGCIDATGCAAELSACVFDGGHTWPAQQPARIRDFLVRHTRPGPG